MSQASAPQYKHLPFPNQTVEVIGRLMATGALVATVFAAATSVNTTSAPDVSKAFKNGVCGQGGMVCSNLHVKQLMNGDAASPLALAIKNHAAADGITVPDTDITRAFSMMRDNGQLDSASPTPVLGKSSTLNLIKGPQPMVRTADGEYIGGVSPHGLYALIANGTKCNVYEVAMGSGSEVQLRRTDLTLITPTGSHAADNPACYNTTAGLSRKMTHALGMNRT